jgi:hypothetical protein
MYSLYEALSCGDTLKEWWNCPEVTRTVEDGICSYKVSEEDESKRYEQEIMEFGSASPEYVIIVTAALLNLICLVRGLSQIITGGWTILLNVFFPQLILCGMLVVTNIPFYEAMFMRKDKGRIPFSITLASIGFSTLALLIPIV